MSRPIEEPAKAGAEPHICAEYCNPSPFQSASVISSGPGRKRIKDIWSSGNEPSSAVGTESKVIQPELFWVL